MVRYSHYHVVALGLELLYTQTSSIDPEIITEVVVVTTTKVVATTIVVVVVVATTTNHTLM